MLKRKPYQKKAILILIVLCSFTAFSQDKKAKKEKMVYICNSLQSKVFHYKKQCAGLKICKDSIRKVTLHHAKNYGRVFCKKEKKQTRN